MSENATPAPKQSKDVDSSLREQIIERLDDYHDGGEFHNYTPLEKERHAEHIESLFTTYIEAAEIKEAEWWSYQTTCLFDELWDDKRNAATVIKEVMDDRMATLQAQKAVLESPTERSK